MICYLLMANSLSGQSSSLYEEMRDKTGTPIVEETIDEFYLWDFTDECHFFVSKITDLTTNKKYGGIVAKTNAPNSTPIAKTSVQNPTLSALTADPPTSTLAYIDMDEIPALVNFFRLFKSDYSKLDVKRSTVVQFSTRAGCVFRFSQEPADIGDPAPNWGFSIITSDVINTNFNYFLRKSTLDNLINSFEKAYSTLQKEVE